MKNQRQTELYRPRTVSILILGISLSVMAGAQNKQSAAPSETSPGIVAAAADKEILAGDDAIRKHDTHAAGMHYARAERLSRNLPDRFFQIKANALKKLAEVRDYERNYEAAGALLEKRVVLLNKNSQAVGLDLGIAFFDLETHYIMAQHLDDALRVATSAVAFYKNCLGINDASLLATCDRRMADVEGMMGSGLFLAKRYDEAEPWFEKVVARDAEKVRPEVMLASLRAYSMILFRKGEVMRSAQFARRAEAFGDKHPDVKSQMDQ